MTYRDIPGMFYYNDIQGAIIPRDLHIYNRGSTIKPLWTTSL